MDQEDSATAIFSVRHDRQEMLYSTYRHLGCSHIYVALIVDLTGKHQARVGGYAAELGGGDLISFFPASSSFVLTTTK
jgi:hypothetical protein